MIMTPFDPPEPFDPPTPPDRALAGALPANEEATSVGAGVASGAGLQMISTTNGEVRASAAPLAPVELPPLALEELFTIDLSTLDVDDLGNMIEMLCAARREVSQRYEMLIDRVKAESIARIKATGGRALPSFEFEKFELEDEYTQYAFDDAALEATMPLLSEADARKIGCVIPEHVQTIPRKFVRGNTAAILALIRKYGEASEVGQRLSRAMSRSKTGERLVLKRAAPDSAVLGGAR